MLRRLLQHLIPLELPPPSKKNDQVFEAREPTDGEQPHPLDSALRSVKNF